ncbi:hypothetical protein [Pseudomonas syringae group genomosp. 3]|uniref:hypothetical protein n=1 Tax=Pseudomonas syringae group genomosp. 3 TaxID=251701 RepID=UPI00070D3CAB|nr:hypothetical protein [Pseudomonas syringae group genomosp. 3]
MQNPGTISEYLQLKGLDASLLNAENTSIEYGLKEGILFAGLDQVRNTLVSVEDGLIARVSAAQIVVNAYEERTRLIDIDFEDV